MHSANRIPRRARRLLLACTALVLAAPALRAGDDFGLWGEVGLTKSTANKKFSFGADLSFRANDNLGSMSRFDVGVSAAYKPTKFLKLSTGFVYIENHSLREDKPHFNNSGRLNGYNVDLAYWQARYRWYFDVTGKVEWNRFTFSLRERYQYTRNAPATCDRLRYRGLVTSGYEGDKYFDGSNYYAFDEQTTDRKRAKDKHYLRSRIGVEYNIRHCPVTPFATYELSNNLGDAFSVEKHRVTAGIDWKIKKQHTLTAAYVYTNSADRDDDGDSNLHAISIGYNFKF